MKYTVSKYKSLAIAAMLSLMVIGPFVQVQQARAIPVEVVGNIVEEIQKGIESALGNAFAHFAASFLQTMLTKIETNYKIANFLYYSDALVSGQYLQDYMDKYVKDPVDQRTVLALIPQFSCGNTPDLTAQFQKKAHNYLGYDPQTLSPADPQYYQKLARMGNFLSTPDGWALYYNDLAQTAEAQAQNAAALEITSPGLKSPRDSSGIVTSLNSIVQDEAAAIAASLNLGTSNPTSVVGQLASSLTYSFLNNFVFKGAVFKEQATCLGPTQLIPVVPSAQAAGITSPAPAPIPNISIIKASKYFVNPGETITLAWDASASSSATRAVLAPLGEQVQLTGHMDVTVTATAVYTLSVYDSSGNVLNESSITVIANTGPRG